MKRQESWSNLGSMKLQKPSWTRLSASRNTRWVAPSEVALLAPWFLATGALQVGIRTLSTRTLWLLKDMAQLPVPSGHSASTTTMGAGVRSSIKGRLCFR